MTEKPYDIVCSSDDRDAWLRARQTGIGASDAAALFGESRWCSPIELYAQKRIGLAQDDEQTEAQFWGLRLERTIAEVFGERTGRRVEWSGLMLRSKAHPWALATLDALCYVDGAPQPLDAKTAAGWKADEWNDGPPPEYHWQAQQQMLVTGAPVASLACLLGGQRLVWCDVERDETLQRKLIHAGERFWSAVQDGHVPLPDGSKSAARALSALYPTAVKATIQLDADCDSLAIELRQLKTAEKAMGARQSEIEALIKAQLGDAELGTLPSGGSFSWKARAGNIDYKAAATELGATPAILETHRRKPTRVFVWHAPKEK